MNWEKTFTKHIEKTIKNIDKFDIEIKNKTFLKTAFLLGDTTLRMFVYLIEEGGEQVIAKDTGWLKRLKKITIEEYQVVLKMILYSYFTHLEANKDYSSLFDKRVISFGLDLALFDDVQNLPREVLSLLKVEKNLDNDFVNTTLHYLIAGYFDRLDVALVRQLEQLANPNSDN